MKPVSSCPICRGLHKRLLTTVSVSVVTRLIQYCRSQSGYSSSAVSADCCLFGRSFLLFPNRETSWHIWDQQFQDFWGSSVSPMLVLLELLSLVFGQKSMSRLVAVLSHKMWQYQCHRSTCQEGNSENFTFSALEALRNALYKFKTYLLTYLLRMFKFHVQTYLLRILASRRYMSTSCDLKSANHVNVEIAEGRIWCRLFGPNIFVAWTFDYPIIDN